MTDRQQRITDIRARQEHAWEDQYAGGDELRSILIDDDIPFLLDEVERLEEEIKGCHSNHHPHNQRPYTPGQYKRARAAINDYSPEGKIALAMHAREHLTFLLAEVERLETEVESFKDLMTKNYL